MSYKSYISKVFKEEHSDKSLSGKSKNVLESLAKHTFEKIAEAAKTCLKAAKRETLKSNDIESAVKLEYGETNLAKKAIACGTKAVTKMTSADDGAKTRSKSKKSRTSKTDAAGLIFPVTRVKNLLKDFGFKRVSFGAGAYLAAVIQCIVSEVSDLSNNECVELNKTRVQNRHVGLAIKLDEVLNHVYKNVTIPSSGVVPDAAE